MIWQVGEAGTNQAKERISGEMLASLRGNDRHGNPRLENLKSFQGEGYCRIDVYEKATGISRWLVGFVALRVLLSTTHFLILHEDSLLRCTRYGQFGDHYPRCILARSGVISG